MQLSLPTAITGTITVVGLVVAGVMYFEEQFEQGDLALAGNQKVLVEKLDGLAGEMATQTQRLDDIMIRAAEARAGREELDEGLKDLRGEFADLRAYVADQLAHHRGEHGRIEGAADTLEGILRRVGEDQR